VVIRIRDTGFIYYAGVLKELPGFFRQTPYTPIVLVTVTEH